MDENNAVEPTPAAKATPSLSVRITGVLLVAFLVSIGAMWIFALGWFAAKFVAGMFGS